MWWCKVVWCTENKLRLETAAVPCGTSYVTTKQRRKYTASVDIQNHAMKSYCHSFRITCKKRIESAQEWRIALYKCKQQQQIAGFKNMWTEQFKYQTPVKTCVQCRWLTFRVDDEEGRDTRNTQQFCQVHVFLTEHVRFHSQTCTTQVTMHFCQVHAFTQYNNVLLSSPCISHWACLILAGNLHNTTQCNSVRSMYFSLGMSSSARRAAQCLRQCSCIRSMCFCFTNNLYAKTQHNVVLLSPCTHQACETTLEHNTQRNTHTHTHEHSNTTHTYRWTLKHNTDIQMNTHTTHIYRWTLKHNINIQMNTQTQHTHTYI